MLPGMRSTLFCLVLFVAGCPEDGKPNTTTTGGPGTSTGGSETGATSTATGPTTGTTPDPPPPAGQCRTHEDCVDFEECVPPGTNVCGGATGCNLGGESCAEDAGCGGTPEAPQICVTDPCCGQQFCQPGCVGPDACGPLGMCGPDARCIARTCDPGDPCAGDNFSCIDGACAVKPCTSDAQCAGVCLLGGCSTGFGSCLEPAA